MKAPVSNDETTKRRRRRVPAQSPKADRNWSVARRIASLAAMVVVPIVLLVGVAAAILYVRLLNGPISISFLKAPIERGIAAELGGFNVSIGESVVALRGHSFEFRLKDVRLRNQHGKTVGIAPLAAVEVSRTAFLSGVISPSRIVLIEPRMLVFYSPESGVSLSIAGGGQSKAEQPVGTELRPSLANDSGDGSRASQTERTVTVDRIDLAKAIAGLVRRARQKRHATSFLDRVGLRNAAVIVDHNGARTALRVPSAEFNLRHSVVSSVLTGDIAIASPRGTWGLAVRAEETRETGQVRLTTAVKDLFPQAIANAVPGLAVLNNFRFPISAKADYVLSSEGNVLAGAFDVLLGAGKLQLPWLGKDTPSLNGARLRFLYRRGEDHITVEPSTLHWAQSKVVFGGTIKHRTAGAAGGAWDFALRSTDGRLATTGSGEFIKLKRWDAKGTLLPSQGIVTLDKVVTQAGGGSLVMDGVLYTGIAPGMSVEGRYSPMSARNFLGFWPSYLARDARIWAAKHVHAGQLRGGTFKLRLRAPSDAQRREGQTQSDYAMTVNATLGDVRFSANERLPPMFAPSVRIDFKDDAFAVDVPQAAFILGEERSVVASGVRVETRDIFAAEVDSVARFDIAGSLSDGLAITQQLGVLEGKLAAILRSRVAGKVRGRFEVSQPLVRQGALPDPSVTGQLRITDGRAKKVWGGLDVKGSNVIVDIESSGLTARGEMLLKGVPVKLAWRRQFDVAEGRQPPLQLKASLDDTDRQQLGLAVNHILQGPINVDVTVPTNPDEGGAGSAHVRVDLTDARITVESLAWTKAAGRQAVVDFEVGAETERGRELKDIRMDGKDVALRGKAQLNRAGKPISFDIADFNVDVVTRLQIKGQRRAGNIWRVSVRGQSFQGRDFFRSLFSIGSDDAVGGKTPEPGLDLDARITNVLGYWDTTLRDVRVDVSKRSGKMIALSAFGKFPGGGVLRAVVEKEAKTRKLVATTDNAGAAFKLVGFYPNVSGGKLQSIINLGDTRSQSRSGVLTVRRFNILGDQVVSEVLQSRSRKSGRRPKQQQRETIQFDWMRVPFLVGGGRFVMRDAELRGPVLGVLLCGKADFNSRKIQVAGTYIPLQGLSSVIGSIPGIGNLLAGPKGEGVIGINFEVRGVMDRPDVLVNPLSAVTPGIFREVFQVACPDSKFVRNVKLRARPKSGGGAKIGDGWRSETFRSTD